MKMMRWKAQSDGVSVHLYVKRNCSKNESEFARYYSIERPSVTKQGRSLRSYFQGTSCNLNFGVVGVVDVILLLFYFFFFSSGFLYQFCMT